MKSKSFIDDTVLMNLLKTDHDKVVAKIVFKKYKEAFTHFFEQYEKLPAQNVHVMFLESFAYLENELINGKPVRCIEQTIFDLLLTHGYGQLGKPRPKNQMKYSYLAGEVLIQLISKGYNQCIEQVFKQYKELTLALLKHNYGHRFALLPQEIYGEAIMILKNNIEQRKLKPILKSRLFTYFYLIARNKYLELVNRMKGISFYPDIIDLERELTTTTEEKPFVNYVEKYCPGISTILEHSNEGVFNSLLGTFQETEQELLRLRFEEGLKFSEIGRRLQLKEATCRKRLHDCLKKWKKQLIAGSIVPPVLKTDRYYEAL